MFKHLLCIILYILYVIQLYCIEYNIVYLLYIMCIIIHIIQSIHPRSYKN